jgi:YHS domain-containing protein
MKRLFTGPAFALALSASAFMTGCGGDTTTTDKPATPAAPATPADGEDAAGDAGATDGAATEGAAAEENEALASFSPAEREAVLAQKICPVTEEELGSMGPPIAVAIGDKTYYVCCEACIDSLKEEPEKYLANIGVTAAAPTEGAEAAPADGAAGDSAAGG